MNDNILVLPEIMNNDQYKLRKQIEELRLELKEKDLKCGALQRNFESLS
jgi:hypothetical protein